MYLGDFVEDATVYCMFDTYDITTGASITASAATVSVYKNDATGTEVTTGVTTTLNHDGHTGQHLVKIDTSSAAFYATGADYFVRATALTVNGQTARHVIGHFSIQNRRTETIQSDTDALQTAVAAIGTDVDAIQPDQYIVLGDAIYDDGEIDVIAWLTKNGAVDTSVSNARAALYQIEGTLIDTLTTEASADANGVFRFDSLTRTLAQNQMYYLLVTIEDATTGGTDRSGVLAVKRFS